MKIKINDIEFKMDAYQASFFKDKEGKVVSVSFPIESFYAFIEDIEDISFLDGYDTPDSDKETISHEKLMKELGLTPKRLKEIRKELGFTQAGFGKKIGYAAGSIRNMETGQQSISNRAAMAVDNLKRTQQ